MPAHRAPGLARERAAWSAGHILVGLDEVGRGPLAGPVVAAAIAFAPDARRINGVRDSKVLSARARETLAGRIRERALCLGIGAASPREIDRYNIRRATALALRRAFDALDPPPDDRPLTILLDGLPLPEFGMPHEALVDGDALCYSVAAAGIVAKTVRDRLMIRLSARHSGYGWERNMGYGTSDHLAALRQQGPTRHHRSSFAPVSQLTFLFTGEDA